MTESRKTTSPWGILAWLQAHQSAVSPSLDELTAQFDGTRDAMQSQLQSLQRYECVKRGGPAPTIWSITAQGRVRLAEGKFSPSGAFLSVYDYTGGSSPSLPERARPVTLIPVP